jgi:hypothetical protein
MAQFIEPHVLPIVVKGETVEVSFRTGNTVHGYALTRQQVSDLRDQLDTYLERTREPHG